RSHAVADNQRALVRTERGHPQVLRGDQGQLLSARVGHRASVSRRFTPTSKRCSTRAPVIDAVVQLGVSVPPASKDSAPLSRDHYSVKSWEGHIDGEACTGD